MGRNKKEQSLKKKTISITLDGNVMLQLEKLGVNKSKLINLLVKNYLYEN